jgi:TldD protein
MRDILQFACDEARRRGVAFADARAGEALGTSILLQDGRADKLSQYTERRLGVRVLFGGAWGFASSEEGTRDGALAALEAALSMARASARLPSELTEVAEVAPVQDTVRLEPDTDPRSVPIAGKMRDLMALEQAMTAVAGDETVNTMVSYSDNVMTTYVANTRGTLIETVTPRASVGMSITVARAGLLQRWGERRAARMGYELVRAVPMDLAREAAATALSLLDASPAPSGRFPVVFHPSVTGLFSHEAIGHNAEADLVLAGESIVEGKLGQRIASDVVTIIDESDHGRSWGSYVYDSEGTPAQRRVLIENGILVGLMHSLTTAPRFGVAPNGSARAQDAGCRPQVRMSNTFIKPSDEDLPLEALIGDIDLGVYARGGQSGYVMCEKGQFTCSVGAGRIIRHGELAEAIRDVSMSGMTLETLHNIDLVGSDLSMEWPGTCGKGGQGMPNNCGGPSIRIKELVVGGQVGL